MIYLIITLSILTVIGIVGIIWALTTDNLKDV